jgi:hypothetical protein
MSGLLMVRRYVKFYFFEKIYVGSIVNKRQ